MKPRGDRAGVGLCGRGRNRPMIGVAAGLGLEGYRGGGAGRGELGDRGRWCWRRFVGVAGGRMDPG